MYYVPQMFVIFSRLRWCQTYFLAILLFMLITITIVCKYMLQPGRNGYEQTTMQHWLLKDTDQDITTAQSKKQWVSMKM